MKKLGLGLFVKLKDKFGSMLPWVHLSIPFSVHIKDQIVIKELLNKDNRNNKRSNKFENVFRNIERNLPWTHDLSFSCKCNRLIAILLAATSLYLLLFHVLDLSSFYLFQLLGLQFTYPFGTILLEA